VCGGFFSSFGLWRFLPSWYILVLGYTRLCFFVGDACVCRAEVVEAVLLRSLGAVRPDFLYVSGFSWTKEENPSWFFVFERVFFAFQAFWEEGALEVSARKMLARHSQWAFGWKLVGFASPFLRSCTSRHHWWLNTKLQMKQGLGSWTSLCLIVLHAQIWFLLPPVM